MKYLKDTIADSEIELWKPNDVIAITSPTGSGKTTFVLEKLLPLAIQKGKKILYLCNRKILKEQVALNADGWLKSIFGKEWELSAEEQVAIYVVTYQSCEVKERFPDMSGTEVWCDQEQILYYVFDEAHYFLNDAMFNSGTHTWIRRLPARGVNIFMTATPEPLIWFLSFIGTNSYDFNYMNSFKNIHDNFLEKKNLREKLKASQYQEEISISILNPQKPALDEIVKKYTQRFIDEECRKIDVYGEVIGAIENQVNVAKGSYELLPEPEIQKSYDRYDTFYFQEYSELCNEIVGNDLSEKWLLFVDDEVDGIKAESHLKAFGIDAVLLSRKTIQQDKEAKEQYQQIIENEQFSCTVLIATSVMDSGVNITDGKVMNIAISCADKTKFLQMLGRRRLKDDEYIKLYVRCLSERQINGMKHKLEDQLRKQCRFALYDQKTYVKVGEPTRYSDGMKKVDVLSESEKAAARVSVYRDQYLALTHHMFGTDQMFSKGINKREYSKTAFLSILYSLSEYVKALNNYNETKDRFFFLKRQLALLGKSYDNTRWIFFKQRIEDIITFISEKCEEWMDKPTQKVFSAELMMKLLELPSPPGTLQNNKKFYTSKADRMAKVPGLKVLNAALTESEFSYKIISKQRTVDKHRSTYWMVVDKGKEL